MNINAGIIDQKVVALVKRRRADLIRELGAAAAKDEHRLKSGAFTALAVALVLDLEEEESLECLCDGGDDRGIDAVHIGDISDNEFSVSIFQSKYSKSLDGTAGFPANGIGKATTAIRSIFDPNKTFISNKKLEYAATEIRALLMDGNIPNIRVFMCNNGTRWESNGEALIAEANLARTVFKHINHTQLVDLLQKKQPINAGIRLAGKMFVENFDHRRVLIGRVPVKALAELFEHHGDKLLDRNIRRYLGLRDNRVNLGIYSTLEDVQKRGNFYFFNNGITAICTKFTHNEFQSSDQQVKVEGFQIVNGGQTSKTIQRRIADDPTGDYSRCGVLLRLYELTDAEDDLVNNITFATNSQNPVDLADLRSNDVIHDKISLGLRELGFEYKRKRDDSASGPDTITVSVAAEAVMAAWRRKPHAAKFRRSRLFGDLYEEVFSSDTQPAYVLLSVLIFRLVESERKRRSTTARFVPYASHFLAMVVGDLLLKKLNLERTNVSHENIADIRLYFENNKKALYEAAVSRVGKALKSIGITEKTPLPRVAAQFRRGDLLEPLQQALITLGPSPRRRRKVT